MSPSIIPVYLLYCNYIYCYSILYYTTSTNDSSPGIFGRFLYTPPYLPPQRWTSSALAEPPCFLEQKIHASNRSSPALEYMTYATQLRSSRSPVEGWNGFLRNGGVGGFYGMKTTYKKYTVCIYIYIRRQHLEICHWYIFFIPEQWPLLSVLPESGNEDS